MIVSSDPCLGSDSIIQIKPCSNLALEMIVNDDLPNFNGNIFR